MSEPGKVFSRVMGRADLGDTPAVRATKARRVELYRRQLETTRQITYEPRPQCREAEAARDGHGQIMEPLRTHV